ncbi:RING-type E3 ubiquitin transferase [Pleurotus pulmonarius]
MSETNGSQQLQGTQKSRNQRRRPPRGNQNTTASSGTATGGESKQTNGKANAKPKRGEIPCKAWRAGSCAKGAKCWFGHDPEAQRHPSTLQWQARQLGQQTRERKRAREHEGEDTEGEIGRIHEEERQREEERRREEDRVRVQREQREQARIADEARIEEALRVREAARIARLAEEEALRKARDAEYQTRMAQIAREDAARTTQFFILGSLVTFGAGLDVRHLITGFECCTVQIKNLPADAREAEIANVFLDQGIDAGRFQIQESRVTPEGWRTATIVTDAESGMAIAAGLEGVEFREEKLVFEVGSYNLPGGMGTSDVRDTDVLTISWRSPSVRFVAEFADMEETRRRVQALNGKVLTGRRVKVTVNTPPPGRVIRGFNPNSIMINNLNPAVDEESIRQFAGALCVKRMRQPVTQQSDQSVMEALRRHIDFVSDSLESFDEVRNGQKTLDGIATVKARFESSEAAERVHGSLSDGAFARRMGIKESVFWVHLPVPMQYTITIPAAQYAAQKHQWDALVESIKDKSACNLVINEQRKMDVVRMRLLGKVKDAVGALKVRVENLAAGEKIEGWHPSLGYSKSQFVRTVAQDTGGFLRADHRRKVLKAYGKPDVVDTIRTMVEGELQKLASRECTFTLQRQTVGFFIRQGVPALQEMFGAEGVRFNPASGMITVRGEDARHTLRSFIDQASAEAAIAVAASAATDQICPVCYDSATNPLVLGCAHVYCTPCMRHLLTSAEEADKFPLMCVGEECQEHIPIPIVQRFLPPADFARLLEAAFTSHVTRNPQSLKYCRTPDCNQIYRAATDDRAGVACTVQCPSCFSGVCAACHEDGHEGMTCENARVSKDYNGLSEAWIRQMKKCPNCQAPIEKAGGCNHMSCRCGAHICWRCMGVFSADTIYEHMNAEHGGINDEEVIPAHVNYEEQELVLRQAREARQRALVQAQLPPPLPPRRFAGDLAGVRNPPQQAHEERQQWLAAGVREAQAQARQQQLAAEDEVRRLQVAREAEARRQRLDYLREAQARQIQAAQEREREREREGRWGCLIM